MSVQPWLHRIVTGEWVLLTYRMPREPSTPRASVWRQLRRLGVAQLSDGLVTLPADARTREQLEWVAEHVREANGTAGVWLARPGSADQERDLAQTMRAARAAEYEAVRLDAEAAAGSVGAARARALRSLRAELRRIRRRDFFPPSERDAAISVVEALVGDEVPQRVTRTASPDARRGDRS